MGQIATKFTSDDAEMNRAWAKAQSDAEKYRKKLEDAQRAGKTVSDEAGKTAEATGKSAKNATTWNDKLGEVATTYLGVNAIIAAGNALLQDQINLQEKAAKVQRSGADIERGLLRNLGSISEKEQAGVLAEITAMSKRTGVSQDSLKAAASEAVSARGSLSISSALGHVEQASRIAPESPSEMAASSRALLNAASITGSEDPKTNLAFLTDLMSQSPSSKLSDISQNAMSGIAGVQGFGGSANAAGALTTTMASAMKDSSMASSSTAAINLARQIEAFTPGGATDDIAFLQKNPSARDAFLRKASFESKALIPSRDILTAGTPAAELLKQNMGGFTPAAGASAAADRYVARLDSTPLQVAENFRRSGETRAHTMRLEDLRSGSYARIRGQIEDEASAAGIGWESRTFAARSAMVRGFGDSAYGRSPENNALAQISLLEQDVKNNKESGYTGKDKADEQLQVLVGIRNTLQAIESKGQVNINAHVEKQ